jgi:hypothetical protein
MTTLYPMRPTDKAEADNYMKDKILEPNEQIAKIIKDGKIYVLTLKEFGTSPALVRSDETPEEAAKRRNSEEADSIAKAEAAEAVAKPTETVVKPASKNPQYTKNQYASWGLQHLKEEEQQILSRPKNRNGAFVDSNNGAELAKLRGVIANKERATGGTRKRKMRSKKTRRHK